MINTIAIVGGGLTSGAIAQTLRAEGYDGRIEIFGDEPFQPYDRPCLSKGALLEPLSTPVEIFKSGWVEDADVDFFPGVKVTAINPATGTLTLDLHTTVNADRIVLATGSRARRLSLPGSTTLENIYTLRTWADSLALRQAIRPGKHMVVIGGGLIGCEIATTATKLGAHVTLLEAGGELLARVLGPEVGAYSRTQLMKMGVAVHLNSQITALEGEKEVQAVLLSDGRRFSADIVLVSIGGEPAVELAVAAGLECSGGVVVDAMGRTSSPNVYAAGDVACWPLRSGGRRCLETYLNSQAQGEIVARAILGKAQPTPQVPKSWTEIAGHRIQMVGDIVGSGTHVLRQKAPGAPALHFRVAPDGYVAAAVSIDLPADFAMAMRIVEGKLSPDPQQLADPEIALRGLIQPKKQGVLV
jgi:biphenyl 2,3-dioxygenase ferredoxin reductase subunit